MFADDLLVLDRLRSEAVNVQEPHVSGVSRLVTYAAQLKWLGGKFPVDVRIYSLSKQLDEVCDMRMSAYTTEMGITGRGRLFLVSGFWLQYFSSE